MIIVENTIHAAKSSLVTQCLIPIAVVTDVTSALCAEGIQPDPSAASKENCFLRERNNPLKNTEANQVTIGTRRIYSLKICMHHEN